MATVRSFIALDIICNKNIENFIKDLKNSDAIIKLVEPENIHLTLKFLGEINENKIIEIENLLKNITIGIKPFKFILEGVGVFPNRNYVKIIWIGIKNTDIIEKLSEKINHEINTIIPDIKSQKFIPHITIGRIKSAKNKEKILDIADKYQNQKFSEIIVESIKLKKSELTPKGPIYNDIITIKL